MRSASDIEQTAAEWAVRCDRGALSDAERRQLDSWLAADVRHLGAWVKARAQWQQLERLAALHRNHEISVEEAPFGHPWSRRALLASLAGVGVLGLGWSKWTPAQEVYTTQIGEMRRIPLADGSTLMLNTDSSARVQLARDVRHVDLLRGEAMFEVDDDPRPFVVTALNWQMRAMETTFGVRMVGTQVALTVTQGTVDLRRFDDASETLTARVIANEQLLLSTDKSPHVEPISTQQVQQRFAWLNGMVVFSGEALREAVAEINRHNRRRLVIDDASLAAQPIVGAFKANDTEAFAAAAAAALSADTTTDGDVVHLRLHRKT